MLDTSIRQVGTASKVDVPDSVARLDELYYRRIRDIGAVAQMDVVQILPKSGNGQDRAIGDEPALGEHQIPQARSRIHDSLHGIILDPLTGSKIQYAKTVKRQLWRELQEHRLGHFSAMGQSKLSQIPEFAHECIHRGICHELAIM